MRLSEAASSYGRALALRPGFVQAFGGLMYTKTYTCDWRDRATDLATLRRYTQHAEYLAKERASREARACRVPARRHVCGAASGLLWDQI